MPTPPHLGLVSYSKNRTCTMTRRDNKNALEGLAHFMETVFSMHDSAVSAPDVQIHPATAGTVPHSTSHWVLILRLCSIDSSQKVRVAEEPIPRLFEQFFSRRAFARVDNHARRV